MNYMDIGGSVLLAFLGGSVFGFCCLLFIQKTHAHPLFDVADITLSGMLMNDYIDLKIKYDEVLKERDNLKIGKRLRKRMIKRPEKSQKSNTCDNA